MADGMSITGCESRELMMSADASAASNTQQQQQQQQQQQALTAPTPFPEGGFQGGEAMVAPGPSSLVGQSAGGRQMSTDVDLSAVPEELGGARLASFMLDSLDEVLPSSPPL